MGFLERTIRRVNESGDKKIRSIKPTADVESCCLVCGLNHQARDFMRAMSLQLIDRLEENSKFVKFLNNNHFLTQDAYQNIAIKMEAKNKFVQEKKICSDFTADNYENVLEKTAAAAAADCQECEKEGTKDWIGLRLCLSCGHVGCCDSSKGMHATKHFVNTKHPVITTLPTRSWKWCYIHKVYG